MAVNSIYNDSFLQPDHPLEIYCLISRPSSLIFIGFFITCILLLLPLCIFIIYLGLQRWRQQRSTSAAVTSHSDVFIYHTVAIELIGVTGGIVNCCGIYREDVDVLHVGHGLWLFTWYGETFFHLLTCVERYLAVVHPVSYLSLRGERGTRIRNISIGFVWLLCFVVVAAMVLEDTSFYTDICFMMFSLTIVSFCSLAVLRVLIRPGPGEQGRDRDRVDQSKRRAFYTILAILGVLLIRFGWTLVVIALLMLKESIGCVLMVSEVWFNLPCSLVLPVLFLHRAGVFICCKNNPK